MAKITKLNRDLWDTKKIAEQIAHAGFTVWIVLIILKGFALIPTSWFIVLTSFITVPVLLFILLALLTLILSIGYYGVKLIVEKIKQNKGDKYYD